MIRYTALTILNLLFTVISYPLAPLVALFCKDNGYLPNWLCWFQTFDAPLDAGVRDGYPGFDPADSKWWNRTKWLWRNPAYGFSYSVLGIPFDPGDWIISAVTFKADGSVQTLNAHDSKGHFCTMTASGGKYGWKVLNYITGWNGSTPVWRTTPWGPQWRTMICFTPPRL